MTLACVLLAAIAGSAACGSGNAPTSPSPAARTIVVLGDSLAVSPSIAEGFPAVLQQRLTATHPGWIVRNQGVFGDTTSDGLRRLDAALTPDTAIVVLELGANDGLQGVGLSTIENNLSAIVERTQARGVRVLLCGMETPPLHGLSYSIDYHGIFPRVASRYRLPLVPFLLEGVVLNPDLNGADEVHPNAAGARRIADTVWPYLEPLVAQATTLAAGRSQHEDGSRANHEGHESQRSQRSDPCSSVAFFRRAPGIFVAIMAREDLHDESA